MMLDEAPRFWCDGRLLTHDQEPLVPAPDTPRCYSTALVRAGRTRFLERHVRRLQRDAEQVGLGTISEAAIRSAFCELAAAAFGDRKGIVRVVVERGTDGAHRVSAAARDLGPLRSLWTGISAPLLHPGPSPRSGAKLMDIDVYARARRLSDAADVDEALLFDADGVLVEGARTNIVVVTEDGALCTPDLALGGVRGTALEALREIHEELVPARIQRDQLAGAREIIAVNAVRGARPVVELDGEPVADGAAGDWARRLDASLQARSEDD